MKNTKHILVTGSHRSGTTWVGRTLTETTGITYVEEPFNIEWPNYKFTNFRAEKWYLEARYSNQLDEIKSGFSFLSRNRFYHSSEYCRELGHSLATPLRFIKYSITKEVCPRYLIKDPIALFSAEWLERRYNLHVVCMIRSPFAFAGSLKKAGWDFDFSNFSTQKEVLNGVLNPFKEEILYLSKNKGDYLDRVCLLWNVLHYRILNYKESNKDWKFVIYEDIASNPLKGFEDLFDSLNIEFDSNAIKYIDSYTSDKNPVETDSTLYKPRNSANIIDSWKERLSAEEISEVYEKTKKVAVEFYKDFDV